MTTRLPFRFRRAIERGFSLIEVMMATAILGLGILGLLALFAGTARQQQIASEATDSLLITGNAQSIIGPEVGTLDDPFGPGFTGTRPLDNLIPNVWYPMTAEGVMDDQRMVGPRVSAMNEDVFFLANANFPGDQLPLYEGGPEKWQDGLSSGGCNGTFTGQFDQEEFLFPSARLEPCSLRTIEVEIVNVDLITGETEPIETRTYTLTFFGSGDSFDDIAYYLGPDHPAPTGIPMSGPCGVQRRTSDPIPTCGPGNDFIAINLANSNSGETRAFIRDINILPLVNPADPAFLEYNAPATPRVQSVTAQLPFQFRRTGIVALDSRLNYRRNNEGQRIPELGYSLLFRRTSGGRTEVMVATYTIQQTESGSEYVPQEDFASVFGGGLAGGSTSAGPLRQVQNVTLGYDQNEQMHYIEIGGGAAQNFGWIVEPGSVVLVQGNTGSGTPPGSELSSEVVSLEIQPTGEYRGYLNRAPRNNGSILLTNLNTPLTGVTVWGIQPTVESQTDGSTWRLRPIAIEPVFLNEVR